MQDPVKVNLKKKITGFYLRVSALSPTALKFSDCFTVMVSMDTSDLSAAIGHLSLSTKDFYTVDVYFWTKKQYTTKCRSR